VKPAGYVARPVAQTEYQLGRRLVRRRDEHQGGDVEDEGHHAQDDGQPRRQQTAAETYAALLPHHGRHGTGRPSRHRYGQDLYAERAVVFTYKEMFSTTVTV
jgi:hypothetical protein